MPSFTKTILLALAPFAAASPLATRQSGFSGSTQNGLDGACKDVTVIFARGTSEGGNVGTVAGPPFFQALAKEIGSDRLAVQGVEYPADIGGIMNLGSDGGKKMVAIVEQAYKKCPNTKVVLSGYSQGAMLVHNAAKSLPAATTSKIAAVVTFGDPFKSQGFQGVPEGRCKVFCRSGDSVCSGSFVITAAHLQYGQDAQAAADFVAGNL
ncbi:hypothetical protein BHE90_011324 [Fusarium euwallaceae]|uniref:Cutinase n=1 Tax=Fusarium euwallaceae TaxID=1147111 RepID=A0A430LEZ1_9HYPO|nr:hypothetical protein BHE90_011324 [Fusarium euwallaceae]